MNKKIELKPEAVALLQRVKAHILEEPRRVYMDDWRKLGQAAKNLTDPPCGTVACIAGWVVELAHPNPRMVRYFHDPALRLLGLDPKEFRDDYQMMGLFTPTSWPEDLRAELEGRLDTVTWEWTGPAKGTPAYAAVVAAAIDRFIASPEEFS
jgi:hypothetical protein